MNTKRYVKKIPTKKGKKSIQKVTQKKIDNPNQIKK